MARKVSKLLLVLIAVCFVIPGYFYAKSEIAYQIDSRERIVISNDLQERGKQLRHAIDLEYKRLWGAGIGTLNSRDLTPVVTTYIPVGTSFDDAEKILLSAGFGVGPRTGLNSQNPYGITGDDKYIVMAAIGQYKNPYLTWFSQPIGGDINVDLSPPAPADYTKVSKIKAYFSETAL